MLARQKGSDTLVQLRYGRKQVGAEVAKVRKTQLERGYGMMQ